MRPVIVRRWEIVIAFVALALAFVGVSIWLTSVASSAHRAARAAQIDAARIGHVDQRVIRIRNGQIRLLCRAERNSTIALRRVLRLAARLNLQANGQTSAQRHGAVSFYRRAIALTQPLDCVKLTKHTPRASP